MEKDGLYQVVCNLSTFILKENKQLLEKINNQKKIITFIGKNLPTGFFLCAECYIPTDNYCECSDDSHCENCCDWEDEELEPVSEIPKLPTINIETIDFDDYDEGEPDYIKRNKARRYGNAIFHSSYDNQWYRIRIQNLKSDSQILDLNNIEILFNSLPIDYDYYNKLLTTAYTIIIPDDYYNLVETLIKK